ncbi:hypothetical protein KXD93_21815 [Mucilaginibacter sp. BJC16-A38]|uniref:hypothetical protein n=1 Tax=Mucilaginibacter phenanthrenivorans TaxID=1234842 RepID=UPI00215813B2|nr:hypothetical protein [Mucilaginibacter phenanthrenivorans]MCR8560305.1 hypothetical protein [Mucilaginibacter phenanthrenivorans]
MLDKTAFNAKVKTWLNEQIRKSVVKEVTECYDLMDQDSTKRRNIFRICKKQLNAVRSKIVLSYVRVLELAVLVYK